MAGLVCLRIVKFEAFRAVKLLQYATANLNLKRLIFLYTLSSEVEIINLKFKLSASHCIILILQL